MQMIRRLVADEAGTSAIEYGLVASLVSVAIIVAAGTLGLALVASMDEVLQAFAEATR